MKIVGADVSVRPQKNPPKQEISGEFVTEIFRKSVIAQWVDVGIDPYESTGENTEIR